MSEDVTTPDASEQLDQLDASDTLVQRGVRDALDEGYTVADNWSPVQRYGNTAEEMRRGDTLEQRIEQEVPEEDPRRLRGSWNPYQEDRQVGSQRAGRLIDGQKDAGSVARDVGIDGAAATAEEAAMHIINEEDLATDGVDR